MHVKILLCKNIFLLKQHVESPPPPDGNESPEKSSEKNHLKAIIQDGHQWSIYDFPGLVGC